MDEQYRRKVDLDLERKREMAQEALNSGAFARADELGLEVQRLEGIKRDGRNRTTGWRKNIGQSPEDKACRAVRKSVSAEAIRAIKKVLPALAQHLGDRIEISVGRCLYRQDEGEIAWEL
jgi:hypothetical protein